MRNFIVATLFVLLGTSSAKALDLYHNPSASMEPALTFSLMGTYERAILQNTNSSPTYMGPLFSGKLNYNIGNELFSIGPSLQYTLGGLQNSANTDAQKEELKNRNLSMGVEMFFESLFLRLAYTQFFLQSKATGTVTNQLNLKNSGAEIQVGYAFSLTHDTFIQIGADLRYVNFSTTANNGIVSDTTHFGYGVVLGIGIIIPSGGSTLGE